MAGLYSSEEMKKGGGGGRKQEGLFVSYSHHSTEVSA